MIVAVVAALAIGVAAGWWFTGREKDSASPAPSSSSTCSTHASTSKSGSPKPVVLPDPRTIKVNVYNATKHRGLARSTSVELAARGFGIGSVANDPLNKLVVGTAEVRYGPARRSTSVMRLAAAIASGFGKVFGTFGARTATRAATLPLPWRSRKRANDRTPASILIRERPPMPSARRAAMNARTSSGVSFASSESDGAPPRCSARKLRNCCTSRR